jgi:autotransporter-associated beta strand protein
MMHHKLKSLFNGHFNKFIILATFIFNTIIVQADPVLVGTFGGNALYNPYGIVTDPLRQRVYVSQKSDDLGNDGKLYTFNNTGQINSDVDVIGELASPTGMAVGVAPNHLWIGLQNANFIRILDQNLTTISNFLISDNINQTMGITVNPLKSRAYSLERITGTVKAFNALNFSPVNSADINGLIQPRGIAVHQSSLASPESIFIANSGSNTIEQFIDGINIGAVPLNGFALNNPYAVALVNVPNFSLWIADKDNNRLLGKKFGSEDGVFLIDNVTAPTGLSINPKTGQVYVVEQLANQVKIFFDPEAWVEEGKSILQTLALSNQDLVLDSAFISVPNIPNPINRQLRVSKTADNNFDIMTGITGVAAPTAGLLTLYNATLTLRNTAGITGNALEADKLAINADGNLILNGGKFEIGSWTFNGGTLTDSVGSTIPAGSAVQVNALGGTIEVAPYKTLTVQRKVEFADPQAQLVKRGAGNLSLSETDLKLNTRADTLKIEEGSITNDGILVGQGSLTLAAGTTFTNNYGYTINISSGNVVNREGTFENRGSFEMNGAFNNGDVPNSPESFTRNGGHFEVTTLYNHGTFRNNGYLKSTINNYNTLYNTDRIDNATYIFNKGTIDNIGALLGTGNLILNNGGRLIDRDDSLLPTHRITSWNIQLEGTGGTLESSGAQHNLNIWGKISGVSPLTLQGTGWIALGGSGDNTYTGNTHSGGTKIVANSRVRIHHFKAFGEGDVTMADSATLQWGANDITLSNKIMLNGMGSGITFDTGNFAGVLTGELGGGNTLIKQGSGTLYINNASDFAGSIDVQRGILSFNSAPFTNRGNLTIRGDFSTTYVEIYAPFTNEENATIENKSHIINVSTLTNHGTINNHSFYNAGTFTHTGEEAVVINQSGSNFFNNGLLTGDARIILQSNSVFENTGTVSGNGTFAFEGGEFKAIFNTTLPWNITVNNAGGILSSGSLVSNSMLSLGGILSDATQGDQGQLVFKGPGTTTIDPTLNDTGFSGNYLVESGKFDVLGTITRPITVNLGATLTGMGSVESVVNYGTVTPSDPVGKFTIKGDYLPTPSGITQIAINPTQSNKLDVKGTARLNNSILSVNVVPAENTAYEDKSFEVLSSDNNPVEGTFGAVQSSHIRYKWDVDYTDPNKVLLVFDEYRPFEEIVRSVSDNPNTIAAAHYVDSLSQSVTDPDLKNILALFNSQPEAHGITDVFSEITSEETSALPELSGEIATLNNEMNGFRLNYLRDNAGSSTAAAGFTTPKTQKGTSLMTHLKQAFGYMRADDRQARGPSMALNIEQQMQDNAIMMSSKGGIWIQGFGSYSKQKATARDLGYKNKARGSLIGVDYKLRPDLFVGGSIGYGLSHVKWDEGVTKGHVKDYLTSLYSTWFQDKFYINASMTLAHNRFNVRRRITFATIDRTAHGRHTGYTFAPSLELGHRFTLMNGFDIVPFIRGDYVHVHEKGYQEKDAGALNLGIQSKTSVNLRSEAGLNIFKPYKVGDDVLQVKWKLSYVNKHPLKNGKITANFVGQPGSFIASSSNKTQHQVSPGLGIEYKSNSNFFVSAAYDAQFESKYKAHEVSLRLGYKF